MKDYKLPKDAIDSIKIKDYEREDRPTQKNLELCIHLDEDHEASNEIGENVIMVKANIFNAVEIKRMTEDLEEA